MESRDFIELVQATWVHWLNHLQDFPQIDCEESTQSLTVVLPDQRVYLFNMHTGLQQLWLSSPFSGGRHFTYCKGKTGGNGFGPWNWHDTRNNEIIERVLNDEFKIHYGIALHLTHINVPVHGEK
jgi:frataxin-like iron-binding protein CyaY